jgi:hypothetical protein
MPDDQRPIDDLLAEDALDALAGRECKEGGGILDPTTGQCESEDHAHCWFCGEQWWCSHRVAAWDDEDGSDGLDIPFPRPILGSVGDWSTALTQTAFGDLRDLVDVYAARDFESSNESEVEYTVIAWLFGRLGVPVVRAGWVGQQTRSGEVFFTRDPSTVRQKLVPMLDQLRRGFESAAAEEAKRWGLAGIAALDDLADLKCPNCDMRLAGPRPWFCSDCRTAVCLTCHEISNAESCRHLLLTEGRPAWDQKTCVACGEALQGWKCTRCLSVHCPFCGVRSWAWRGSSWTLGEQRCPHLIASWDASAGEWWDEPNVGLDQLEEIAIAGHDGAAVRVAFGKLARLAETIEEAQQAGVGTSLLDALTQAAGLTTVVDVFWDDANGMGSDTGTDYFAADPVEACAALRALVDRLLAGQDRLAAASEEETPQ